MQKLILSKQLLGAMMIVFCIVNFRVLADKSIKEVKEKVKMFHACLATQKLFLSSCVFYWAIWIQFGF